MYHFQSVEDEYAYAFMVLKPYAVRVRDALLLRTTTHLETTDDFSVEHPNDSDVMRRKMDLDLCENIEMEKSCRIVWDQQLKGVRKSRRGYTLLIIWNAKKSPGSLHPIARQQMSWAARLSHRMTTGDVTDDCKITDASFLDAMANFIMREILSKQNFCNKTHKLRLDIHPKELNEPICTSFQKASLEIFPQTNVNSNNNNPSSGRLHLTKSASQASFVISIILLNADEFVFGVSNIDDFWIKLNGRLNHHAAADVVIEPTNPKDGLDLNNSSIPPSKNVPVSRAYYKLQQIYEELLLKLSPRFQSSGGSGLDIGAAPGGWSQVLYNSFGLKKVISVDPAILAKRVVPFVQHIKADFTSDSCVNELASYAPFSIVVCDACSNSDEIFSRITNTLQKVSEKMKEKENKPTVLTVPSSFVVTFKLPHKTPLSIERNLKKDVEKLPQQIQNISNIMMTEANHIQASIQILHLLANSESERTVVVTFDKK